MAWLPLWAALEDNEHRCGVCGEYADNRCVFDACPACHERGWCKDCFLVDGLGLRKDLDLALLQKFGRTSR